MCTRVKQTKNSNTAESMYICTMIYMRENKQISNKKKHEQFSLTNLVVNWLLPIFWPFHTTALKLKQKNISLAINDNDDADDRDSDIDDADENSNEWKWSSLSQGKNKNCFDDDDRDFSWI